MAATRAVLVALALATALGAAPPSPAEGRDPAVSHTAAPESLKGPADVSFRLIPGGQFLMGCAAIDGSCDPGHPDYERGAGARAREAELPRHPVRLPAFYLAETETTRAQYAVCVTAGACRSQASGPAEPVPETLEHPAVGLSWDDARGFCEWIGGRLPTEAEWEYAARAGAGFALYPTGESLARDRANYGSVVCCSGRAEGGDRWLKTAPVGSFPPSSLGLYDMAGNVWEYVADWYAEDYYTWSPGTDPAGPAAGEHRTMRGGSWLTTPDTLRSSSRGSVEPTSRDDSGDRGFRCAREPVSAAAALPNQDGRRDPFRPPTCVLAALAGAARSATATPDLRALEAACNKAKGLRSQFLIDAELDLRNVLFQAAEGSGSFRDSLLRTLAEIQVERGEYLAAAAHREALFAGSSSRRDRAELASAYLLIAERASDRGDAAAARRPFQEAIEHLEELGDRPQLARAYASLAVTCGALCDPEQARQLLERAVELDAECAECRDNLARFWIERGSRSTDSDPDEARTALEQALALEPSEELRAVASYRLRLTLWEDELRELALLDEAREPAAEEVMRMRRWSWKARRWTTLR